MIVDDDDIASGLLATTLKHEFDVLEVISGEACLQQISTFLHYCPVKRDGESLKALNGGLVSARKFGVDLNVKMKIRKNSGATPPGVAHEHWQDAVRATDGFSAVDDLHSTC